MDNIMTTQCVNDVLNRGILEGKIHGACVAISRHGEIVTQTAIGYANIDEKIPLKNDSIFRIFSMTKPITSMVTMMLWEMGKLELTDPLWWYFPTFRNKKVDENGKLVDAKRDILLTDLLNMTSGLPYPDCGNLSQQKMGAFFSEIDRRNNTDNPVTTTEFAETIGRDVPLMFHPGDRWQYGTSADILGAVLEKVADMPLDELYRQMIFTPLSMQDTDFYVPTEKYSRLSSLYQWDNNAGKLLLEPDPHLGMTDYKKRPAFFSGGAGLCSTLNDYLQFAMTLAARGLHRPTGKRLLSENTWRYMTTPAIPSSCRKYIDWEQLAGYSYGNLLRVLEDPQKAFTNAPRGEYGWDGWTGPYVSISPNNDETAFVYMIQVCGGSTSDIVRRLCTIAYAGD